MAEENVSVPIAGQYLIVYRARIGDQLVTFEKIAQLKSGDSIIRYPQIEVEFLGE